MKESNMFKEQKNHIIFNVEDESTTIGSILSKIYRWRGLELYFDDLFELKNVKLLIDAIQESLAKGDSVRLYCMNMAGPYNDSLSVEITESKTTPIPVFEFYEAVTSKKRPRRK